MLSRRDVLKISVGATVAWLVGACQRGSEGVAPTPTLVPVDAVTQELKTSTADAPTATPEPTASATEVVSELYEITVPDTETHVITTSIVKREYKLFVGLPSSYAASDKVYPVLYVLDANDAFVMLTEIARLLNKQGMMPELIIIGIGYNVNRSYDWQGLRIRDYTPTYLNPGAEIPGGVSFPTSGKAETFLRIIREEIKPFIGEHYRVDPFDAAILGHSAGGLFGLYTLFHQPDTFNRYILGSPAIWWDNAVTYRYESEYATEHDDLLAKVFMAIGEFEGTGVDDVYNLAQVLQDRQYANLEIYTAVFDDESHNSIFPTFITRGILTVYKEDRH